MPITKDKAPDTLPDAAKNIYVGAWNGAYSGTCKNKGKERDACASKIAWAAVKAKYAKQGEKWVPKAALVDVEMKVIKASLWEDGSMHWQAQCSDTDLDNTKEATSLSLFQDWIGRIDSGKSVSFLPPPRMPFLGVSHYPSLEGEGEAGPTEKVYIDSHFTKRVVCKARGVFNPSKLGQALFQTLREEQRMIKRNEVVEQPIRISAGWWDLAHKHGNFVFERKSLFDVCPMCEQGAGDKVYLKGQLDHFAATRVPINPRTSLALEEKAMAKKTTRKADAASIVGDELAEELEEQVRPVGKSETELPEAMVVKADDEPEVEAEELATEPEGEVEAEADAVDEPAETEEEVIMSLAAFEQTGPNGSNWSNFTQVIENILEYSPPDELRTNVQNLMDEFGDRVAAIKAAVEDAVLIETFGGIEMSEETKEVIHPVDALKAAYDAAMTNEELDRQGKLEAIQTALEQYAGAVKAEVDAVAPPDPGEAVQKAMLPVLEKLDLIAEKIGKVPQAAPQVPQQKSFVPKGPTDGQPDFIQKPPSLRDIVRRSVGIEQ